MFNLRGGAIYSIDDVNNYCLDIARRVKFSDYYPDIVVGVSEGGVIPARQIGEALSVPVKTIFVSRPSRTQLFKKVARFNKFLATLIYEIFFLLSNPQIKEPLEGLRGKDILLVDDMAHTGKTLRISVGYLNSVRPKSVKTAVISNKSDFMVDYFCNNLKIIFPWSKDSPYYNLYSEIRK